MSRYRVDLACKCGRVHGISNAMQIPTAPHQGRQKGIATASTRGGASPTPLALRDSRKRHCMPACPRVAMTGKGKCNSSGLAIRDRSARWPLRR